MDLKECPCGRMSICGFDCETDETLIDPIGSKVAEAEKRKTLEAMNPRINHNVGSGTVSYTHLTLPTKA